MIVEEIYILKLEDGICKFHCLFFLNPLLKIPWGSKA